MKKDRAIFSSFHTMFRLVTTSEDIKGFALGLCRLYKSYFKAERIVLVCKSVNSYAFMKFSLEGSRQRMKKGGVSILTKRERELLQHDKELVLNRRLVYPFSFFTTLGAVYVKRSSKENPFSTLEIKWFISLCEQVSLALKFFSMKREQKKLMVNYVKSLTDFLDKFVPTSYLHAKTAFKLIRVLSKQMKLSEAEMKSLEYASLLHDTGKIKVPSKLLQKQKPLTDEEFKLIMKHPKKGVEMIKDVNILKPVIPIILHHHERYDGKGYPSRLKKDKIPLGSRILAILDAFDAMYYGRPYRKRRGLDEVEEEFKQQMGKQFDPKIVQAFLKVLRRKDVRKFLQSSL